MIAKSLRKRDCGEGRVGLSGGRENRASCDGEVGDPVYGAVCVDDPISLPIRHAGQADLVVAVPGMAADALKAIPAIVEISQSAISLRSQPLIQQFMGAYDGLEILVAIAEAHR